MKRRVKSSSKSGKIQGYKIDPGVFVIEIPETGRYISLGQPPDVIKRMQQVGYFGANGVTTFVLVDSKLQGDSISWVLTEFPILYALYFIMVKMNGNMVPTFFAGKRPMLVGLPSDVRKAMAMIKYGNYGMDDIGEIDAMDIPAATKEALRKEILGLAVGNEIKDSSAFLDAAYLDPEPNSEQEFTDIGDGIRIGRIGYNTYRILYGGEMLELDVTMGAGESFRSPVEYKHLKFPVMNFGIWHTGEYDGMDPYYSCAHTSIIHRYEPILIDYPSNMTDIINHNGLSKHSINTVFITHNHDDHIGAMVELFRRSKPCHLITTEPVRFSVVKKLAALVDLPEKLVQESFRWTILPFRQDNPYQTESINFAGLHVTGHLSCHSVPTTVYTFKVNCDGRSYHYGHFLDITAFKRMQMLVKEGWMPQKHLDHLDQVVRKTPYSLIKYDAGCTSDAALPFTVHGQWQDLKGTATDRANRVFTHATKSQLDPAYETEGRFVSIGDLDSTLLGEDGRLVRLGADKTAITAFFQQAYSVVWDYFRSLMDKEPSQETAELMNYYASAFANCPKRPDPSIGAFLFQQGAPSDSVVLIVRGRAEIITMGRNGKETFRSVIGDGELVGDVGVLSGKPRMASVKSLNRISYLAIPSSLFIEAMEGLSISYEGDFKNLFERRLFFQSASEVSRDVSTITLNRIARISESRRVRKGEKLVVKGQKDARLTVFPKSVEIQAGGRKERIDGPSVVGECEFFLGRSSTPPARLVSAVALQPMEVLIVDSAHLREIPVLVDNIRQLIRKRRASIYADLKKIDPTYC